MTGFTIESSVVQSFELVSENFSQDLFLAIAPAFPPSELIGFDGDKVGGLVQMKIGVGVLSKIWISEIVSREKTRDKMEFIDVGRQLPPPLKKWRHRHVVKRERDGSTSIIDDIQFTSGWKMIDYGIYPVLKFMFSKRTRAYRKYFDGLKTT